MRHSVCTVHVTSDSFLSHSCNHPTESIVTDPAIVERNILSVKLSNADYKDAKSAEDALRDFHERIRMYESVYETIGEEEESCSYIKIFNCGEQVCVRVLFLTFELVFALF